MATDSNRSRSAPYGRPTDSAVAWRWCRAAACCAVLGLAASGCRSSQSTSITNPFLSADRVPAPPSRIPAPGTAQPYYQEDALPPVPAGQPSAQPGHQPSSPAPGSNQPYGQPSSGQQVTPLSSAAPAAGTVVRVPADEASLRFDGTAPAPPAEAPSVASRAQPPTPPALAAVRSDGSPEVTLTPATDETATAGLFREPAQTAPPPRLAQAAGPPRIRVPESTVRVHERLTAPSDVRPASYHTTSPGRAAHPSTTTVAPSESSPPATDGFRPRGSSGQARERGTSGVPTLRVTPG